MTPLTLATFVASAFVPGTPAAAAVARTGIVMSFSWVPPRSHSNAAGRAIGVPSEEFAAERAAFAANAGIDGFHADDSAVLEAATEGDEIDHLEELYAPPVTDICTFGHDAPLPAMSVDDLPAPPKKGLFGQPPVAAGSTACERCEGRPGEPGVPVASVVHELSFSKHSTTQS